MGRSGARGRRVTAGVIDQIADTVERIRKNPDSRRLLVTAWNPADVDKMALPPCHCLFQFYVVNGKLSCQLYQRSADIFLGVPFNIASYALLTHMMAHVTGLKVGEFIHTLGDAHIYLNHLEQIDEQLSREPYALPRLVMKREVKAIDEFRYEDFEIVNYQAHPNISGRWRSRRDGSIRNGLPEIHCRLSFIDPAASAGLLGGLGYAVAIVLIDFASADSGRAGHLVPWLSCATGRSQSAHLKSRDHRRISGLGFHRRIHLVGFKISRRRCRAKFWPCAGPTWAGWAGCSSSADF